MDRREGRGPPRRESGWARIFLRSSWTKIRFGGALRELLSNALESGGPAVQIRVVSGLALPQEVDRARATLRLSHLAPLYVFVGVEDNGLGVSDDVGDRMFDPFFTTRQLGRGLGLATVASVVRRHRGTIVVDRSSLGGCRIRFYLPVQSYRALAIAIEEEAQLESTLVNLELGARL